MVQIMNNEKWGVYGYVNEDKKVVYIGIDRYIDKDLRHKEHNKPSKAQEQLINIKLREENLTYLILAETINKEVAYTCETALINEYRPIYNVKMKNEGKK